MEIQLTEKITLSNIPDRLRKNIVTTLSLPNPVYYKMLRMGNTRALYNLKSEFRYYTQASNGSMLVGRGMRTPLLTYIEKCHYPYRLDDRTVKPKIAVLEGDVVLREYQQDVPDVLARYREGVIRMDTGYGKTVIATKLLKDRSTSTIILVPRQHLLNDFREEIKKWYGYDAGIIQGNTLQVKDITIAMIQTLVSNPKLLASLRQRFGMVIVDECHTAITEKRLQVIQQFNARYLFGLTATPDRTDEQGKAIHFTFGPIIIDRKLPQEKPIVKIVYSDKPLPIDEYAYMVTAQVECAKRNTMIADIVREEFMEGRKIMVLTKRIDHYERIHALLQDIPMVYTISSKENDKERVALIRAFKEGTREYNVILGTYPMLATGTDIPNLDTLVFAGDLKSSVLQRQSVGRILRIFSGKKHPKIIDIIDTKNGIFYNQGKQRIKFYKENEWL